MQCKSCLHVPASSSDPAVSTARLSALLTSGTDSASASSIASSPAISAVTRRAAAILTPSSSPSSDSAAEAAPTRRLACLALADPVAFTTSSVDTSAVFNDVVAIDTMAHWNAAARVASSAVVFATAIRANAGSALLAYAAAASASPGGLRATDTRTLASARRAWVDAFGSFGEVHAGASVPASAARIPSSVALRRGREARLFEDGTVSSSSSPSSSVMSGSRSTDRVSRVASGST